MKRTPTRLGIVAPRSQRTGWVGAYIFTRNYSPELVDDVILDVVVPILEDPLVKGDTVRAFFIRYADYGPHVRLRIKARGSALARVRAQIEAGVAKHLTPAQQGTPTRALPETASPSSIPSLVFTPYVPEEVRYGGRWGLAAAESFFHTSSHTSVALLAAMRQQQLDRVGVGLGVMVAILHGLSRGERQTGALARSYADSFGQGWFERWYGSELAEEWVDQPVREHQGALAPQLKALRKAARDGALPDIIKAYSRAAAKYRRRLATLIARRKFLGANSSPLTTLKGGLAYVAPSLLHMTTNRLGIDNPLECRLSEGLARSYLGEELDHTRSPKRRKFGQDVSNVV